MDRQLDPTLEFKQVRRRRWVMLALAGVIVLVDPLLLGEVAIYSVLFALGVFAIGVPIYLFANGTIGRVDRALVPSALIFLTSWGLAVAPGGTGLFVKTIAAAVALAPLGLAGGAMIGLLVAAFNVTMANLIRFDVDVQETALTRLRRLISEEEKFAFAKASAPRAVVRFVTFLLASSLLLCSNYRPYFKDDWSQTLIGVILEETVDGFRKRPRVSPYPILRGGASDL